MPRQTLPPLPPPPLPPPCPTPAAGARRVLPTSVGCWPTRNAAPCPGSASSSAHSVRRSWPTSGLCSATGPRPTATARESRRRWPATSAGEHSPTRQVRVGRPLGRATQGTFHSTFVCSTNDNAWTCRSCWCCVQNALQDGAAKLERFFHLHRQFQLRHFQTKPNNQSKSKVLAAC